MSEKTVLTLLLACAVLWERAPDTMPQRITVLMILGLALTAALVGLRPEAVYARPFSSSVDGGPYYGPLSVVDDGSTIKVSRPEAVLIVQARGGKWTRTLDLFTSEEVGPRDALTKRPAAFWRRALLRWCPRDVRVRPSEMSSADFLR